MKKSRIFIGLAILLLLVALYCLLFRGDESGDTDASKSNVNVKANAEKSKKSNETNGVPAVGQLQTANNASATKQESITQTSGEKMAEGLAALNDSEVRFYGKAIDQYGKPVVDAHVQCGVIIRNGFHEGMAKHQTRTDQSGEFRFSGFSGESIGIAVSKPGYERESDHTANSHFIYSHMWKEENRHHPDPRKPVIFKMWKLSGAEPMVVKGGGIMVPCDGKVVLVDLITGKPVESGGDIKIILERTPVNGISRSKGFDWKSSVEFLNGGLIEQNDNFPYLAPTSGYKPSYEINMMAGTSNWTESITKTFYIKLRDGKMYGRMKIQWNAFFDPPPTFIDIKVWINPTGSRNLEYEYSQSITPERIKQIGLDQAILEARHKGQADRRRERMTQEERDREDEKMLNR